jgi:hypothetical protein
MGSLRCSGARRWAASACVRSAAWQVVLISGGRPSAAFPGRNAAHLSRARAPAIRASGDRRPHLCLQALGSGVDLQGRPSGGGSGGGCKAPRHWAPRHWPRLWRHWAAAPCARSSALGCSLGRCRLASVCDAAPQAGADLKARTQLRCSSELGGACCCAWMRHCPCRCSCCCRPNAPHTRHSTAPPATSSAPPAARASRRLHECLQQSSLSALPLPQRPLCVRALYSAIVSLSRQRRDKAGCG